MITVISVLLAARILFRSAVGRSTFPAVAQATALLLGEDTHHKVLYESEYKERKEKVERQKKEGNSINFSIQITHVRALAGLFFFKYKYIYIFISLRQSPSDDNNNNLGDSVRERMKGVSPYGTISGSHTTTCTCTHRNHSDGLPRPR